MALPRISGGGRPLPDVAVYSVQKRFGDRNKRPWVVRWAIVGRQRSRAFRTKTEAERYRSGLLLAQQNGEPFDLETGEPVSWQPLPDQAQVHTWAKRWLAEQWPEWAPRTRFSAVEALSRLVPLLLSPTAPPPPDGLRAHLMSWLRPEGDSANEAAAAYLDDWSLQLGQLTRPLLAEADQSLGTKDDGESLSAWTASRFRKVSRACIRRAVELDVLDTDPWPPVPLGRSRRKAVKVTKAVNVRTLPNPETMAKVIAGIGSHQPASRRYQVMTSVAYYVGLRPSEVVVLRAKSVALPKKGWGRIDVTEADVDADEPGEPKTGARTVPIPRPLVDSLAAWVKEQGFTGDDYLFRTRTGGRPSQSNWARALQRSLAALELPSMRVYDCRHAAATTWLAAGVPLGHVAKRLGHSVETLVSTYVGALEDDEALANDRIDAALTAKPRQKRR